jgi:hypothetical protein
MTSWNFDINTAPKGTYEVTEVSLPHKYGDKKRKTTVFKPEKIFTASSCGKVIVSYWIPEYSRWVFYTKEDPPIAWYPAPEYPKVSKI